MTDATPWTDLPTHRAWLQQHAERLLEFGRSTAVPGGGAAWLDDDGARVPERGVQTWITCRTVHVYSLGHLLGIPGARDVAQGALDGLRPGGILRDAENGGWYGTVLPDGSHSEGKEAYQHAFALLAGTSGVRAGLDGAPEILESAIRVYLEKFWDEAAGLSVDTWDTAFTTLDPYRGVNANMHSVEAMLAVADVTGDDAWLARAARVASFVVHHAAAQDWRIPEHFDADWVPEPDLNRDRPDDPFKPFGATVGHGLEWARLLLHLEASLAARELPEAGGPAVGAAEGTTWAEAAAGLFDRAVSDGWEVDGAPGFVYTTDWSGEPVVHARMHWVIAEAINTAAALHARTGEPRYADRYASWWGYADRFVLDHERGSWRHELDAGNRPTAAVWPGKADLYHAFQATLVPRLPLAPSMATAVADGLLR